jgi:hypothetical protein
MRRDEINSEIYEELATRLTSWAQWMSDIEQRIRQLEKAPVPVEPRVEIVPAENKVAGCG